MQRFMTSVDLYDGARLSYLHTASRRDGDIVHQKDRQTLVAYEELFAGRAAPSSVLEIGIYSGGSLAMWKHLWPEAKIVGVDITLQHLNAPAIVHLERARIPVHVLEMPHPNVVQLGSFDLIIDDGAHGAWSVLETFKYCWPMLKPGGLYVVEDWHLDAFEPVKIAGTLAAMVIGTDHGEHFCDGPFPANSAERVVVLRRMIAIFKRGGA